MLTGLVRALACTHGGAWFPHVFSPGPAGKLPGGSGGRDEASEEAVNEETEAARQTLSAAKMLL